MQVASLFVDLHFSLPSAPVVWINFQLAFLYPIAYWYQIPIYNCRLWRICFISQWYKIERKTFTPMLLNRSNFKMHGLQPAKFPTNMTGWEFWELKPMQLKVDKFEKHWCIPWSSQSMIVKAPFSFLLLEIPNKGKESKRQYLTIFNIAEVSSL